MCRYVTLRFAMALAAAADLSACAKVNPAKGQARDAGNSDRPPSAASGGSGGGGRAMDARGFGGFIVSDAGSADARLIAASDPETCEAAATKKAYVGCDYWPTVVANSVWSIFDFAVAVANGQTVSAAVTVTGPGGFQQMTTVAPGAVAKIYLPWVSDLKGPDTDECGRVVALTASVLSRKGAYHLVSTVPVTVYQFNALEYRPAGGPPGKNWSTCPGRMFCEGIGTAVGCLSYQNDASLLLPTTAMTGNYRITGVQGWSGDDVIAGHFGIEGGYFAVTATADDTKVKVQLSAAGQVLAGGTAIPATRPRQVLTLMLQQGDVAEIVAPTGSEYDFSGSLINADKPVQVITGIPCTTVPANTQACDHVEESVLPVETLGKNYIVAVPTSPAGTAVGHVVRLTGNVDETVLTYAPAKPSGCPTSLQAGQVVDCGVVSSDFQMIGTHEFGVAMFQLSAQGADPDKPFTERRGDPSQSVAIAVEQYRLRYIFLAPDDYTANYVDVTGPMNAVVMLDGAVLTIPFTAIGSTGYGVARVKLTAGQAGAHMMSSDLPVGIQVLGYGDSTSYQYPGGLNLEPIAAPPIIIE